MHPDGLDQLGNLLGATKDALLHFGRRVGDAVAPLPALCPPPDVPAIPYTPGGGMPPDAADVSGFPTAYQDAARQLEAAMLDLFQRARVLRQADEAVGRAPSVSLVAATAELARSGVRRQAGRPLAERAPGSPGAGSAAKEAARALQRLLRDGDDDEVRQALDALRKDPAYRRDPAYAAVVVNTLGARGLRDLAYKERFFGKREDAYLCSLSRLAADASRSGQLDPGVLDDLVSDDSFPLSRLTRCGNWHPDHAYRLATALVEQAPSVWRGIAGLGQQALVFLSRHPDAATRFLAEHADRLTGPMMLHLRDLPDLSSEVGLVLLASLKARSEQYRADTTAAFEQVIRTIGDGRRVSAETRQAAAAFIAQRMEPLVYMVGSNAPKHQGLTLTTEELKDCMAELVKDQKAWAVVAGGVATELRRRANQWAEQIAGELAAEPDLMRATEAIAGLDPPDDQWVGSLLGTTYQGVVDASDDAKEAAARLHLVLGLASSTALSLVPVAGAASANIGVKALAEIGSKASGTALDRATEKASELMTDTSGKRPEPAEFRRFVEPEVRNVMAVALYNNAAIRAKLVEMGMRPPPPCCLQKGVLSIPAGSDETCGEQFRAWFEPPDGNPLFTVSGKFIHSDDGLMHAFESKVLETTAGRTD
jgi:hypothetical protein